MATKFKVESGGQFEDVPRSSDRSAIISDPRADENLIISGLRRPSCGSTIAQLT